MLSRPEAKIIPFPTVKRDIDQLLEEPERLTKAQREALDFINAETAVELNGIDALITVLIKKRKCLLERADKAKQNIINNP